MITKALDLLTTELALVEAMMEESSTTEEWNAGCQLHAEVRTRIVALLTPEAPASVEVRPTPETTPTKVLSRGAWKTLRLTRKGTVKAALAGLTREEAFYAGLTPGFHLPTGDMRSAIKAAKAS